MKVTWMAATFLVAIGASVASYALKRITGPRPVQAPMVLLLVYAAFVMILWGMESNIVFRDDYNMTVTQKNLVLGVAGGVLARALVWLDRLARGRLRGERVAAPIYEGLVGACGGLVGLAIASQRYQEMSDMPAQLAGFSGIAGGSLGVGVLHLALSGYRKLVAIMEDDAT